MNAIVIFILLTVFEGIVSLLFLISLPGESKNVLVLGFSPTRLLLIGSVLLVDLTFGWVAFHWMKKGASRKKIIELGDKLCASPRLLILCFSLLVGGGGIGIIFGISWLAFGIKYLAIYQRLAPVIFFVMAFCLQCLFFFRIRFQRLGENYPFINQISSHVKNNKLPYLLLLVSIPVFSVVYFKLAMMNSALQNTKLQTVDQGAYLSFVQEVKRTDFKYTGDRNRMPLYPYLQALFLDPDQSDQVQFRSGRQVNIVISWVLLFLLYAVVFRFLNWSGATTFIIIASFALFVFKAGYFQTELLFYALSFLSFITFGWVLSSPSYKWGILAGGLAALAHLTKASILPMIAIFLGFYLLNMCVDIWKMRDKKSLWLLKLRFHSLVLLCVIISFLAVLFPYLQESKQVFGQYFYNVNSTFYIWYDDWAEAKAGTRAHGDRVGWPQMPPEEIPGFQKYLREHTPAQIVNRFIKGLQVQFENLTTTYTRFNYLGIYLVALLVASLVTANTSFPLLKQYWLLVGFFLTTVTVYLLLFAWYVPISNGPRFTLSLFLPLLFSMMLAFRHLVNKAKSIQILQFSISPVQLLDTCTMILLLVGDLVKYIPTQLATHYFGN